jgi:hypothetical protein
MVYTQMAHDFYLISENFVKKPKMYELLMYRHYFPKSFRDEMRYIIRMAKFRSFYKLLSMINRMIEAASYD